MASNVFAKAKAKSTPKTNKKDEKIRVNISGKEFSENLYRK